ncbi:MAG: SDR family oxidoreductase [Chloroflexi bacterium]|nr:SDR family oxidoreductase [Chloroflexota bacterium]MCI0575524.1 SDR family oxidoreductase [Chloroflexota bacterium]MCI0644301.1 SDR family oxidoreductase [Chloroflexota bacterium]MCI0726284.1 SDR family oxidoreductase [Chloroflexota bacterium]
MNFTNKVVLVTGASRGIGRAIAQQFAETGARVALHYHRNRAAAEEALAALPGGRHHLFQADQASPEETQRLVEAVVAEMGRIDVLVNNAGIYEEHPPAGVSYGAWQAAWQQTLATNLVGPANLCYCVAQQMIAQSGGRIVNISSRGAFRGEPDAPAYGASKAGLNAMSQSLAKALAPHGIFVCVVAPGWVETDMAAETLAGPAGAEIRAQSPLNRVARPDEVARAVLFLASEGTDFLTGCIVDVNGASYLRT